VPHHRVPALLSAMDVGVALARADEPFHYSPLKLAEYLAAGLPTVAPSAPHLVRQIGEHHGVTFVEAGDVAALVARLRELRDDPAGRAAEAARARAGADAWSWDSQVVRVRARVAEVARAQTRRFVPNSAT
jgi:glycosyltransferase involved in cell wall biosynthesis